MSPLAFIFGVTALAVLALIWCGYQLGRFFRWWGGALVLILVPVLAMAQDVVFPLPAGDAGAAMIGAADIEGVTGAFGAGKILLGCVLLLGLGLRFFRGPVLKRLPASSGLVVFLKGSIGGWVLNFLGSLLSLLAAYLSVTPAGGVTTAGVVNTVIGAVVVSFSAGGFHEFTKDVGLVKPKPVASPAAAAAELALPPKP